MTNKPVAYLVASHPSVGVSRLWEEIRVPREPWHTEKTLIHAVQYYVYYLFILNYVVALKNWVNIFTFNSYII